MAYGSEFCEHWKEYEMYRTVGFFVVTGFAIYGAVQFCRHHVVTSKPETSKTSQA